MTRGVFVAGTDTGVGKTVVAAGLAACLRSRGLRVAVMKPFATGSVVRKGRQVSTDALFLAQAAECRHGLDDVNPICLRDPLAPAVAAARESREIDFGRIRAAYDTLSGDSDVVLVEGVGGVAVPVTETHLVADLRALFDLPMCIVARPSLGTINHTLLTVEFARRRGWDVRGIVFNTAGDADDGLAAATNPTAIERWSGVESLGCLPSLPGVDVDELRMDGLRDAFDERINWCTLMDAPGDATRADRPSGGARNA